jgi:AraC family L-rhamnose operon regulatory protein RhaS
MVHSTIKMPDCSNYDRSDILLSFIFHLPVDIEHLEDVMPRPIPIYKDQDETYRADSCGPLVAAASHKRLQFEALRQGHYPGRILPAGAMTGLKMAGFWDAQSDQDWGLDWHRNEGLEVTFLESGSLKFSAADHQYSLCPDHLTIMRPWQRHRVGGPNVTASRLIWVILDVGVRRPNEPWKWPPWFALSRQDIDELTNILRHNEQPIWTASPDLRKCFHVIAQAVAADRDGSHISRLLLRISELFLLLLEMLRARKLELDRTLSSTRRTVELFLHDLRAHRENLSLKWTLEEMANSCGLGLTQFVHHVRCVTNMSPLQYLNHCRLDCASGMLRESRGTSITEVALACGFSSSQYFATQFDRRFGMSPKSFRASKSSAAMERSNLDGRIEA